MSECLLKEQPILTNTLEDYFYLPHLKKSVSDPALQEIKLSLHAYNLINKSTSCCTSDGV